MTMILRTSVDNLSKMKNPKSKPSKKLRYKSHMTVRLNLQLISVACDEGLALWINKHFLLSDQINSLKDACRFASYSYLSFQSTETCRIQT